MLDLILPTTKNEGYMTKDSNLSNRNTVTVDFTVVDSPLTEGSSKERSICHPRCWV